jgi:hypothetical protein
MDVSLRYGATVWPIHSWGGGAGLYISLYLYYLKRMSTFHFLAPKCSVARFVRPDQKHAAPIGGAILHSGHHDAPLIMKLIQCTPILPSSTF